MNVDGYEMSYRMYEEAARIKLTAAKKQYAGACLVVQIDRQAGRPAPDLQLLVDAYEHGTLAFAQEEPFWKEIAKSYLHDAPALFAVTSTWLVAR